MNKLFTATKILESRYSVAEFNRIKTSGGHINKQGYYQVGKNLFEHILQHNLIKN
ncbi:MAG: hypothetical protein LHV68_00855 [Elusimicrobia bacterium]|nr:hypothetical protein [Candidatus Liberimonas magnetica]